MQPAGTATLVKVITGGEAPARSPRATRRPMRTGASAGLLRPSVQNLHPGAYGASGEMSFVPSQLEW
jgi:hypothetical protein